MKRTHTHNGKLDLDFFLLASLINQPVNLKYFTSASQICFMYIHCSAFILFELFKYSLACPSIILDRLRLEKSKLQTPMDWCNPRRQMFFPSLRSHVVFKLNALSQVKCFKQKSFIQQKASPSATMFIVCGSWGTSDQELRGSSHQALISMGMTLAMCNMHHKCQSCLGERHIAFTSSLPHGQLIYICIYLLIHLFKYRTDSSKVSF